MEVSACNSSALLTYSDVAEQAPKSSSLSGSGKPSTYVPLWQTGGQLPPRLAPCSMRWPCYDPVLWLLKHLARRDPDLGAWLMTSWTGPHQAVIHGRPGGDQGAVDRWLFATEANGGRAFCPAPHRDRIPPAAIRPPAVEPIMH